MRRSDLYNTASWGRARSASVGTRIGTLAIFLLSPLFVLYFYTACVNYQGALSGPLFALWTIFPPWAMSAIGIYAIWIAFQVILAVVPDGLHTFVPGYRGGRILGPITPAGNEPPYQINGLQAWVVTHLVFLLGAYVFGWWSPTIIADNWGPILWGVNILGFGVAIFAYIKARAYPTYPQDRKFSGSIIYDFYMGIELHPRIRSFDLKLFINTRVGIVAWTLINWSFAAKQYADIGTVTNSMLLVNLLQAIYVIGFFWNESWYLKTIDIAHDHFGWMFAWGSCTWLPYMYTLQGLYLAYRPVHLSTPYALFVLILGLFAYALLRWANSQKDLFRRTGGDCKIWGKPAEKIDATYTSSDGAIHKSNLLISGWWRVARHVNYTGDLLGAAAYGLACGFGSFIPYFYLVFMTTLLIHRCLRDEQRCQAKYGDAWRQYCHRVRFRLIPGIF